MEEQHIITVPATAQGMRVDAFLARHGVRTDAGDALSRSAIARAISSGAITLNARRTMPHTRVAAGDRVAIAPAVRRVARALTPQPDGALHVLYAATDFLVVHKPAGLLVHPSHTTGTDATLAQRLLARYPELATVGEDPLRPGIVHRLDRETSGLLIIARTPAAFAAFKRLFKERRVHKTYEAIVHGAPPAAHGSVDFPIARSVRGDRYVALRTPRDRKRGTVRAARTDYRLVRRCGHVSHVRLWPQTGRTHQLRVHLHALGCPIVGDKLYRRRDASAPDVSHHLLHAAALRFRYGAHDYAFALPLPATMAEVLRAACAAE